MSLLPNYHFSFFISVKDNTVFKLGRNFEELCTSPTPMLTSVVFQTAKMENTSPLQIAPQQNYVPFLFQDLRIEAQMPPILENDQCTLIFFIKEYTYTALFCTARSRCGHNVIWF